MKTTIEEIDGQKYTVIWHISDEKDVAGFTQWAMSEMQLNWWRRIGSIHVFEFASSYATALPALPRNPEAKHAALLYRYAAEGLEIMGRFRYWENEVLEWECTFLGNHPDSVVWQSEYGCSEITHATDAQGNVIEVAIEEK